MDSVPQTKRCSKCGQVKPRLSFYKHKRYRDGLGSQCKDCIRQYYSENRDRINKRNRDRWPIVRDRILTYQRAWEAKNPDKLMAIRKRFKENNPEALRLHKKRYRDRHSQELSARQKQRRRDHPGRFKDTQRRYRKNHPENGRENARRRAARKANAPGGHFTDAEFKGLCRFYGSICLKCRRDDLPLTADHVVPLSRGGSDEIANIQPLCHPCNSGKCDKIEDFRPFAFVGMPKQMSLFGA